MLVSQGVQWWCKWLGSASEIPADDEEFQWRMVQLLGKRVLIIITSQNRIRLLA